MVHSGLSVFGATQTA